MKVGILGSGVVGQALAAGFLKYDYEVMVGTSHEEKLSAWGEKNPNAKIGSFAESAEFGDVIVLAVKGNKAKNILSLASKESLDGKIIIDVTNPIDDSPPENGVLKFFTSLDASLMEDLQQKFPDARFVKAFSCIGSSLMVNPDFNGVKPSMFICGNEEEAKKEVGKIVEQFGFEVEDMGNAESARAIEPLCILWCIPGFIKNEWTHAFKMLHK